MFYYYYYYYWNNKKHKLDLKDKIKDHKNFDKKKTKKNQKKEDQIKISIILIENQK